MQCGIFIQVKDSITFSETCMHSSEKSLTWSILMGLKISAILRRSPSKTSSDLIELGSLIFTFFSMLLCPVRSLVITEYKVPGVAVTHNRWLSVSIPETELLKDQLKWPLT